jgi:hypothetical protein
VNNVARNTVQTHVLSCGFAGLNDLQNYTRYGTEADKSSIVYLMGYNLEEPHTMTTEIRVKVNTGNSTTT